MFATTMKIGRTSDSRRIRQQVGQQRYILRWEARFTPSLDSADCTIVMQWQRRLTSFVSDDRPLFLCITAEAQPLSGPHSLRASSADRPISVHSQTEEVRPSRKKSS